MTSEFDWLRSPLAEILRPYVWGDERLGMDWLVVTMLGACGGAIVQLIDLAVAVKEWQKARREARVKRKHTLPKLTVYVDVPADSLVFLTRLALGAVAGFIFHGQIVGATAAVAVGASAPALLKQLGALHSLNGQVEVGTTLETAASKVRTEITSVPAEEG